MVVVSFGHGCRPIVLPHPCRLHIHNACIVYKCLRMGRGMSQAPPKLFPPPSYTFLDFLSPALIIASFHVSASTSDNYLSAIDTH